MQRKPKEKPHETAPPCAVEGCPNPGDYRAPRSHHLSEGYQYFCLDHVREFNRAWDYFSGWSRDQIENFMRGAHFGHRPTWKIGSQPVFTSEALQESFFKMLGEEPPSRRYAPEPVVTHKEREALAVLGLEPGTEQAAIKAEYKRLVKKYHPDVNKGEESEETFKRITAAYTFLVKTDHD